VSRLARGVTLASMSSSRPAALLGVPYDAASSFRRGPAAAPRQIRRALASAAGNSWSEQLVDISAPAVLSDAGDINFDHGDIRDLIDAGVTRVLATGARPILLGGDHSITFPAVRAVSRTATQLTVLHVDAHSDLYDSFEGDRYSHACPFARIMEEKLATRLVQVGIRTLTRHQREQADRFHVEVIDMRAWDSGCRPVIETGETVYLSVDMDGIDPAFAPGVSHPEPGGLTVREVVSLIQRLAAPLAAADVVECNPEVDPSGITSIVAAKLVKEIAAAMHRVAH
jgi:arginase